MSFGGFGGGNAGGGFGGFGSTNNNTAASSGGSLFGSNTATSGFGGGGGFGASNTGGGFGQSKPAFGAPATTSSGGGMFGGGTSTSGGFGGSGGFGNTNNAGAGFGNTQTQGGLFGSSKPAAGGFGSTNTGGGMFGSGGASGGFGASTSQPSNPFGSNTTATTQNPFGGGASSTGTGFGGGATTGGFGSSFGGNNAAAAGSTTQGTAATPFSAVTEKDGTGASATNVAYQSITMQQPYQNKSFEELRVEDYAQNRRLPQSSSFGSGGGAFGGFGQQNNTSQAGSGMFGSGNTTGTTGGFGSTTSNTGFGASTGTGFGAANTGGGLFGQNKPATGGGLFGNAAASSGTSTAGFGATSGGTGGLFGSTNNQQSNTASTGFGGGFGNTQQNNTQSGGLFGQSNGAKPAFGGFGSSTANNNTTGTTGFGGFGQNNQPAQQNQAGGLFGSSTNNNTGGSLFGNNNNQPKASGSLFGNNGGASNTGGGLFGNNNQQQGNTFGQSGTNTGGSLFGSNNAQPSTGGSLFGNNNNQAKPPGSGLFGASATNNNSGGSLFGNSQQNTGAGGSLFGNNNQPQQNAGGSLFGSQQNKPQGGLFGGSTGGGSLFGGNNQNNAGGSLFGNNNNQSQGAGNSLFGGNNQNQNQNAGGSLFGSQQAQQQPTSLTASLNSDPYGNAQLFTSLASPSPPVGPLATPLSGAKPAAKPRASLLASVRSGSPMLGAGQSLTPKTRPGYGFSYSNYNSPVSGTQSLTPGAVGLLRPATSFGSSLPSKLSKSFSSSNLRSDVGEGGSLLRTPTAGQGSLLLGNGSFGSGSSRKLKINRDLRNQPDLFGDRGTPRALEPAKEPDQQRKRVSFDQSAEDNSSKQPASGSEKPREEASTTLNGTPDPSRTSGSGLDSVPEEADASQQSASSPRSKFNVEPGEYYSIPSIEELKRMPRTRLENMDEFIVGRRNVGRIVFGRTGTVNLTQVDLDKIFDNVVQLMPRSATVYSDTHTKPARGHALNVPSTIYLEHTGPRKNMNGGALSAREVEAHKRRLRRVKDTDFKDYDPETNIWTFTVDHYTTYGLDDSDDDDEDMDEDDGALDLQPKIPNSMKSASSGLSEPPPTAEATQQSFDSSASEFESPDLGEQDDTFEFKLARRSQQSNISIPGGFGGDDGMEDAEYEEESLPVEMQEVDDNVTSGGLGQSELEDPFIEAGAVQPPSPGAMERYHSSLMEEDESQDADEDDAEDQDVPGSFRAEPPAPKSILKPTAQPAAYASPEKVAELPWEEQLQRTISPKKRDRQALRDMQASLIRNQPGVGAGESPFKKSLFGQSTFAQSHLVTKSAKKNTTAPNASVFGRDSSLGKSQAFTTGMDLINSLWSEPATGSKTKSAFSEMQYSSKRQRFSDPDVNANSASLHNNLKPSFDGQNTLVYATHGSAQQLPTGLQQNIRTLAGRNNDVRFARFTVPEGLDSPALQHQKDHTKEFTETLKGINIPRVGAPEALEFVSFLGLAGGSTDAAKQENAIWSLCSVLFDPLQTVASDMLIGMNDDQVQEYEAELRLDYFRAFWSKFLEPQVEAKIAATKSAEEKALFMLTKGDIVNASRTLFEAGNVKLATVVSQLPGTKPSRAMMQQQIENWRQRKDWSEFSDAHKAIYSIVSGEVCTVAGVNGTSEDRTREFDISERFGLDWKEALALEVYYGGSEDLPDAISVHVEKCEQGKEKCEVKAWNGTGKNEDTLRTLVRLAVTDDVPQGSPFDPATVSGSALNSRLAWQLALMLSVNNICQLSDEELNTLTLDFATQLEAAGDCNKAAWVLKHLTEQRTRNNAIKTLLERNAAALPLPSDDQTSSADPWNLCTLGIPHAMIWEAKALYAHSVLREPALQADWLLQVNTDEANAEAHDVLCQIVGPQAVIEQDYRDLSALLEQFVAKHEMMPFTGWKSGGKVYVEFLKVVNLTRHQKQSRQGGVACSEFRRGIQDLERMGSGSRSLEVRVAVGEMKRVLVEVQREIGVEGKMETDAGAKKGGDLLEGYVRALGVV